MVSHFFFSLNFGYSYTELPRIVKCKSEETVPRSVCQLLKKHVLLLCAWHCQICQSIEHRESSDFTMAGMEQLEIHSKVRCCRCFAACLLIVSQSYLVRWVDVKAEQTISWSIQPQKKSIDFGIFKHPGSGLVPAPKTTSASYEISQNIKAVSIETEYTRPSDEDASSQAVEKLKSIGMKLVYWHGNCEANTVTTGKHNVSKAEGGMYALIFDNTFAKSFSKTVTFVLLIYPTSNPPLSSSQSHINPAKSRPALKLNQSSSDSIPATAPTSSLPSSTHPTGRSLSSVFTAGNRSTYSLVDSNIFSGILQKRRRKKAQGYARRYFTLDFTSGTLSYYHDRNASTIRGSVPLSLAAIGTDVTRREISIDSGAEIWHLKALNQKDFDTWRNALDIASQTLLSATGTPHPEKTLTRVQSMLISNTEESQDWNKVEALVSRISNSRDLTRTLARDTDPKYLPSASTSMTELSHGTFSSDLNSPDTGTPTTDISASHEKRIFWKRKTSGQKVPQTRRSTSNTRASPSRPPITSINDTVGQSNNHGPTRIPDESLHSRCLQLMQDLDEIVHSFSNLIAGNKLRRISTIEQTTSDARLSLDSSRDEEFFDAEVGESNLFLITRESDDEGSTEIEDSSLTQDGDSASSDLDETISLAHSRTMSNTSPAFPSKSKGLDMSKYASIQRRAQIAPPTVPPPSLIGFLRKNVGKDLSTISMHVTANEPLSLLQRVSEQMEYAELLNQAAEAHSDSERLMLVTAFALSQLSGTRIKERILRKPFNPMLGETFELIREDRRYRLVAEKVTHRPVRVAYQADAEKWSISQSSASTQKFWGKSAELVTEGKVRVSLHELVERYSWIPAVCFLRNILAGEKYVEPAGTMTIQNETNGSYAVATFKAKGMFSGRSEEVTVVIYNSQGQEIDIGLSGKWTESFILTKGGTPTGKAVWTAGALVADSTRCYGFTEFAASLNEVNPRDADSMAPTDSRLRPDQRALENGDYDTAEDVKTKLEEAQRQRRKATEEQGQEWQPAWFTKVQSPDGEEVWKLKSGRDSYWDTRARRAWKRDRASIFEF